MKREPKTFRSIKKGSIIYIATPFSFGTYKITKREVYFVRKDKTEYGQRNVIFFGSDDYFYASPNNTLEVDFAMHRYSPNLENLKSEIESFGANYVIEGEN